MIEAMVYLISRTVPEDLQPAVVVLAFAELPVVWAEVIGRPEEEIIDMLAEFYLTSDDLLELSGLPGGCTAEARQSWARSQAEQTWAAYDA
jgi:hypothetical protein